MAMATSTSERVPMKTKLAFGVGAIGEAAPYIVFNYFNMLFYQNVLGLSGTLCGLAVTIALVADAIADPVIGFSSDRLRSRLGRRHPFMYAAPIPLAVAFFCIYSPPVSLTGYGLFAWLAFFTFLFRQAVSLFSVPHLALGAELTEDYRQRSVVMSYTVMFQNIGGAGAFMLAWTWIHNAPGGQAARESYLPLGLAVGAISALAIFVSTHFTRDQIPRLRQPAGQADEPRDLKTFFGAILACLRNPSYLTLLVGMLFLSGTIGIRETLGTHVNLFFWELPASKIRYFGLASPPAYLIAFLLISRLHHRAEKRTTAIFGVSLLAFASIGPLSLRLIGAFPENGSSALLGALMGFHFLFYLGLASLMISVLSALADVADEHELKTGKREEGMFYAARTFFAQLTNALGHLLAGIALDAIKFPAGAKPGTVPDEILNQLAWIEGPIGTLPALGAIFFYARFRIDRRRHAEIRRALEERKRPEATQLPASDAAAVALGA